jgi:hypothetical protein
MRPALYEGGLASGRGEPTGIAMAATTQEIPREAWRGYFDEFSRTLGTAEATIEVSGRDLGDQITAERLVLTGMTYDDRDDVFVIGLDAPGGDPEEYQHLVEHPQKVLVATGLDDVELAFDIADAEDHQHIVRLRDRPALPGD